MPLQARVLLWKNFAYIRGEVKLGFGETKLNYLAYRLRRLDKQNKNSIHKPAGLAHRLLFRHNCIFPDGENYFNKKNPNNHYAAINKPDSRTIFYKMLIVKRLPSCLGDHYEIHFCKAKGYGNNERNEDAS